MGAHVLRTALRDSRAACSGALGYHGNDNRVTAGQVNEEADYPFSNWFADGSIRVLEPPIDAKTIERMTGFEKFTRERAPYRNFTHEQYRELGLHA